MSKELKTDLALFAAAFVAGATASLVAIDTSFAHRPGAAPTAH